MKKVTVTGTIKEIIETQNWDVIVFQQLSNYASKFESIQETLYKLSVLSKKHCLNPNVTIAWQSTWAWSKNKNYWPTGNNQFEEWVALCNVAENINSLGIDIIIPTATAIQNARYAEEQKNISSYNDFTRDQNHLDFEIGRAHV